MKCSALFHYGVLKLCILKFLFVIYGVRISGKSSPPHVVFIVADDLGWNDVSFHGSPQIPTPNIDALAASGIVLEKYYSTHLCTPSRGALMSGKYPIYLGLQHEVIVTGAAYGLPLKEKLLPGYLKDLGYETHGIGKWHLGACNRVFLPTNRGFDSFFGYWFDGIDYYDHTGYKTLDNTSSITEIFGLDLHDNENIAKGYQGQYATDLFTDKALKIIKEHDQSKPLFLYFSHLAAHVGNTYQPFQAPFQLLEKFKYITNIDRRIYAATVFKLDESVGRVFEGLREAHMLKNTIIIFVSDNGAPAEGLFLKGRGSNWPLRGMKRQLFEGGVRVLGLIWSPLLKLKKPRVSHQLMHVSDWLPTLYAAAGGNTEDVSSTDGINIWDQLFHNEASPRREILLNIDPISGQSAMIYKNFKLMLGTPKDGNNMWYGPSGHENLRIDSLDEWVWKHGSTVKNILEKNHMWILKNSSTWRSNFDLNCQRQGEANESSDVTQPQLFDLSEDPCEYNNVAESHPKVLELLHKKIEAYNASAEDPLYQEPDIHSDPRCFDFSIVPWLDEDYKSDCPDL